MKNIIERVRAWLRSRRIDEQPLPEEDPVVNSSLATPIALTSLALVLTLGWALYQEIWGLRPWKEYQGQFVELYRNVLTDLKPQRAQEVEQIQSTQGYQELLQKLREAEETIRPELAEIEEEEALLRRKLAAITDIFTSERSRIQAKVYEVETSSGTRRSELQQELERLKQRPYSLSLPEASNGPGDPRSFTFEQLESEFNTLKERQGQLQARKLDLLRGPSDIRRELDDYIKPRLTSLSDGQIEGLLNKMDEFHVGIKQIYNPEMGLVDRCESCHAGIREPVDLNPENMNGHRVFNSHPRPELLEIHDPEVFGCSPCHNGNGVGTVSVEKAHGDYQHWLWPLYAKENYQAGCLQCHEADRELELADNLNAGKQLFYERGCWGCHVREGFETEQRLLRDTEKSIQDLLQQKQARELQIDRTVRRGDQAETNEEASRLYARAEALTMGIADIESEVSRLTTYMSDLMMEVKMVGPNLKEARNKLRPEWIPAWIRNTHDFRPTTKMPQFRLDEDQVQAISAFIWQSAVASEIPPQPAGDPVSGKALFESRGCMACHAVGEGDDAVGGTFAANLSRVGEKANYDYLVRWVHNPRERSRPYCPTHQRDLTPEDYAQHGLPFRFDFDHNRCPLGDHLIQVQQQTVMPKLRLTTDESRDIASYLMTLKRADSTYPAAPYLSDRNLFEKGNDLVNHFGCAGCHEIAGLEVSAKIGTDLTDEGSKPVERLDFALLTHDAKKEGWYNHKGFFEHKLADPAVFDEGKIKAPLERLRMPNFTLSDEQIDQVTTYLLGSVDTVIPEQFFYRPADERRYIQEGWWVIAKYNCMGCHQVMPGQQTVLEALPRYQTPEGKEQLPPSLVGEGARVRPDWLSRFLQNPSLSETDRSGNGVRPYLDARMPTFNLSDDEVQKLVRFFSAMSQQPLPYLPAEPEPLSPTEWMMARTLFTHNAAPCLKCHATGGPVTDPSATAPNFLIVKDRLRPDWTQRWIVHPEIIRPGTAMPSGLFRREGGRWVFALADVPSLRSYEGDHAELMVRYMFQFTPEEQRRVTTR